MWLGPRTLGQGAAVLLVCGGLQLTPFHELRDLGAWPLMGRPFALGQRAPRISFRVGLTVPLALDKVEHGTI